MRMINKSGTQVHINLRNYSGGYPNTVQLPNLDTIRLLVNISPITAAFKSVSDTLCYNTEGIRLCYLSLSKVLFKSRGWVFAPTPD